MNGKLHMCVLSIQFFEKRIENPRVTAGRITEDKDFVSFEKRLQIDLSYQQ